MRIKRIEITAFGKFKDFSLDFSDGFNLIYGDNEDGKSTVMAFIALMLYGSAGTSGRTDISKNIRKKYAPWSGEAMSGDMEIEEKGRIYRIHKEFKATLKSDKVSITDMETGEKLNLPPGMEIGKHFFGLDYQGFEKSVFGFGADVFAGEENADISARLSNISESGDENISPKTAILRLDKAKEELVSKRGNKGRLVEINNRIESLKEHIANLKVREEKRVHLKVEYESLEKEAEELNKQAKKAREYVAVKEQRQKARQYRSLAELMGEEQMKKAEIKERSQSVSAEDLAHFSKLNTQKRLAEENLDTAQKIENENQKKNKTLRRTLWISGIIGILIGIIGGIFYPWLFIMAAIGMGFIAFAVVKKGLAKSNEAEPIEMQIEEISKEISDFLANKNCDSEQALEEAYRRGIALEEELKILEKNIKVFKETYEIPDGERVELLNLAQDIENKYPLEDIKIDQDEIDRQIREKNNRLLDIKGQLGEAEDIGSLEKELSELYLKQSDMEDYYNSLVLASEVMAEAADEMSRSFAPKLKTRASQLLTKLTKGRYTAVNVSKTYDIEVKTGEAGAYRQWQYLSRGTCAQSYLALRLAVCEMLEEDGGKMPLMLDDVLADYDREREKQAAEFLEEYAENGRQVLFFTCHNWQGKVLAKPLVS